MKLRTMLTALGVATVLTGCSHLIDTFTISEAEVVAVSQQACQQYDAQSRIAPANNQYARRLDRIAKNLGNTTETGVPLNYKVYLTPEVNAWAMANGCIRVYSGLMDMMTDDEVQGVVGHEIGHVALGHATKRMQTAMLASMGRDALAQFGGSRVAALSQSELGALTEQLINSQYSQANELEADNYSFDLLKSKRLNTNAIATSFDKLATYGGGSSNIFSSHPDSAARAKNIRDRIAKEGG